MTGKDKHTHVFLTHARTHTVWSCNTNSVLATFAPSALHMKSPTGENNIDLPLKKAVLLIAFTRCAGFLYSVSWCVSLCVSHMHKYKERWDILHVSWGVALGSVK